MGYRYDYPPELDGPDHCEVCGKWVGAGNRTDECACPECPICTEVGNPDCYRSIPFNRPDGKPTKIRTRPHMDKGNLAFGLEDLADHLGCNVDGIGKRLFKDTEFGISFWTDGTLVVISGYAEGSGDATCTPHEFTFPINLTEFNKAVVDADNEGCELFEEFHCSKCGGEIGYEEACEECDT